MENGHKWFYKVLENPYNNRVPVFCMHPRCYFIL